METPLISILMPVFNERERIQRAVEELKEAKLPWTYELIIVDDGSQDGTQEILKNLKQYHSEIILISSPQNEGKGSAVRKAVDKASGKYSLIQDADLEYDPKDIPMVMAPLMEKDADVVFGSRFWGWQSRRVLFFWHAMGHQSLTLIINMLTDLTLTDVEVGYKAFKTSVLKGLNLQSKRFEIEIEMTVKAARRKHAFYEVPISYHGRTYAQGKKITWVDGFKALYAGIYYRFFSRL
jgi:glycosyltransferase involved in cell wall biosynthesis